uniref:Uncharacterized protein n=1 Tax=Glossina brevipalpis TaxID=37001 RepID=A0A1A9VZG1_9MUSC
MLSALGLLMALLLRTPLMTSNNDTDRVCRAQRGFKGGCMGDSIKENLKELIFLLRDPDTKSKQAAFNSCYRQLTKAKNLASWETIIEMKVAILNYTGTVGKTTIAAHLLSPRMNNAPIFSIKSINETAEGLGIDVEKMNGSKFRELITMSQENKTPRIARDTLITELLGDLGVVHDEIKKPPSKIENVLADSIRLVAKSVNDVESTAEKIKTETQEFLSTLSKKELENHNISSQEVSLGEIELLKTKISQTINNAVEKSIGEPLSESKETINKLNNQLHNSTSPMPRSGWATIIILIFVSTFFGIFSLFSYLKNISLQQKNMELQQDINFENRRFAYHMKVINR